MKSVLNIPLGRQIQLAISVFVLLAATMVYGPLAQTFRHVDLALRDMMRPRASIAEQYQPIAITIAPRADVTGEGGDTTDYTAVAAVLRQLNGAASVTFVDPLPQPPAALLDAIRYNGSVYLTDAVTPAGLSSSAEVRAAARGIGHSRLPSSAYERHRGLAAWSLSGNQMRASAALIPLLPDSKWRSRNQIDIDNPDLRIIPTRGTNIEAVAPAIALAWQSPSLAERSVNKHVYVGTAGPDNLAAFARAHTAIASGSTLGQPHWAQSAYWLIIAIGTFAMVSLLWRESRRIIVSATITLVLSLLVAQWALANQWHLQLDLLRPLASLVVGCLVCLWVTPDSANQRRESFRAGLRYFRAGKLDAAFRVFRHCPPNPSLMPTLYKLALAFEKKSQPEQARAVFKYMAGQDKHSKKRAGAAQQAKRNIPAEIPETLGRYEVLRPLGNGAMGGVFLGRDPRINRLIALKIVSFAAYDDDAVRVEARARFFQEAESAGRLTHPGITAVYDSGEEKDIGYIALEYAPGRQMTEFTQPGQLLDPLLVLRLMTRVAEALDYAHAEHVIHRDIKPANLIFSPETETVKITDFGVAKLLDAERTQTGLILGTPSYMSPEQTSGNALTGSSDLFSLGVSLYELLSGRVPFSGSSIAELMEAINTKSPQPISTLRNDLPPGIDSIIERALAKQPANRFASGDDMAFALRECASQMFNGAMSVRAVNQ